MPDKLQHHLSRLIHSYRQELADLLAALVAIPTENPPGKNYKQCADLLAAALEKLGLETSIAEVPTDSHTDAHPRYSILSSYGAGSPALYFHGHYDVVPASVEGQFQPRWKGEKLFGRGAADMKSGLAAMIYAVRTLKESGTPLHGRVNLVFVPDEETGGPAGTAYLVRKGLLNRDAIGMLTPEPTGGVIWNASRGALSLRVRVKGKAAHVGLHYQGVNAFEGMVATASALLKLKAEVEQRVTNYHIEPERARRSILLLGGQSGGGTNFNSVPADSWFTLDRRFNPEEDLQTEKQRLLDLFQQLRADGVEVEAEFLQEGRATATPEDSPLAQALSRSVEEVGGRAPRFELCPGLLETRYYAGLGIPALAYGPGLLSVSHGPNEFVSLDDVERCAAVYARIAAQLLAG
jgi:acetylornithine deacetylase/succinyl-diaminopimelate desuccinylase family protein